MTLQEAVNKLKAEALVLSTCFGLSSEQLAPVEQAIKASDELWNFPGHVDPTELEAAADAINDAIEDVCIANKISDMQIERLLP